MEYIKPDIRIERFDIVEEIANEAESSAYVPDIDIGNDNGNDFGYETASAFSEAFKNIF